MQLGHSIIAHPESSDFCMELSAVSDQLSIKSPFLKSFADRLMLMADRVLHAASTTSPLK
jgi:hypothetical protein